MHILAHRGLWNKDSEKNSIKSFKLSFDKSFGIETDLRDFQGSLVISHDPVINNNNILSFENFLKLYRESKSKEMLALNIKSDGIISKAESLLKDFQITNYFFFDMSIPQLIEAKRNNINKIFCRHSEYESTEKVLNLTSGVWLDSFDGFHQNLHELILYFLNKKIFVAIVSPELHIKDHKLMYDCWEKIKSLNLSEQSQNMLMLCTDNPLIARDYFKK